MKEQQAYQQQYWVHTRGITVLLPEHVLITKENQTLENERLRIISEDGTLKKRYPVPNIGYKFMEETCMERRSELVSIARELTPHIVDEWKKINTTEEIGVILFGSAAKGLVKDETHTDPSNIDLAVIGNISQQEKLALLSSIRQCRDDAEQKMKEGSTHTPNAGVHVQDVSKLTNGHFNEAIKYIGSGAFALYDPLGIWERIEKEALEKSLQKNQSKTKKHIYKKNSLLDNWIREYTHDYNASTEKEPIQEKVIYQNLSLEGFEK